MKLVTLLAVLLTPMTVTRRTVVVNGDIAKVVIPIDVADDTVICAEYRVRLETPKPRTCVDAAQIRQWILADGKPTELCH